MSAVKFQVVRLALFSLVVCLAAGASAEVIWNEPDWGDVSNDRLAPTLIPLSLGTNSFIAFLEGADLDYITVVVPEDHQLSELVLTDYVSEDGISFIGVQAGGQMTVPTDAGTAAGLLGWTHFGDLLGSVGMDILPVMGTNGFFSDGFTPPLPSGPYTFWIQQREGVHVDYQFDFEVTSTAVETLAGDYNGDDAVDAADYTVWRDNQNQNVTAGTGADGTGPKGVPDGVVDMFDYNFWKANFGEVAGAAAISAIAAPESTTMILALTAIGGFMLKRRPRNRRSATNSAAENRQ